MVFADPSIAGSSLVCITATTVLSTTVRVSDSHPNLPAGIFEVVLTYENRSLDPRLDVENSTLAIPVCLPLDPGDAGDDEDGDGLVLGPCVTHAAIEDGRVPDVTGGALSDVAGGIAYRAARTAGTIGRSLAPAAPASDCHPCPPVTPDSRSYLRNLG